jgi:hypothetical protein
LSDVKKRLDDMGLEPEDRKEKFSLIDWLMTAGCVSAVIVGVGGLILLIIKLWEFLHRAH